MRNPEPSYEVEPQFVGLERLNAAVRAEWMKACAWEGIKPDQAQNMKAVQFSPNNPYMKPGGRYDKLMSILQNHLNNIRIHRGRNPKFPEGSRAELINLFHLARTAGKTDRHSRLVWAAAQYHRQHPGVNAINAYMVVDEATRPYYRSPYQNPVTPALFREFHQAESVRARRVKVPVAKGNLLEVGRVVRIEYEPEGGSKHKGTRFYHVLGDTGDKTMKSNTLLATDEDGKNLFLLKDDPAVSRPYFSDRGIIG